MNPIATNTIRTALLLILFCVVPLVHAATNFADGLDKPITSLWYEAGYDVADGPFGCGWNPDNVNFLPLLGHMGIRLDNVAVFGRAYSCGQYQTTSTYSYGTYTARLKAAKGSGVITGFFTYDDLHGSAWDEIDVEILGKDTTKVQFNYYKNGVGGHEKIYTLPAAGDAADSFHTYSFSWTKTGITWFVDGVKAHSVTGDSTTLPAYPGKIMANVWTPNPADAGLMSWAGALTYVEPLRAQFDCITYATGTTATNCPSRSL